MRTDQTCLFIDIDDKKIIFSAGKYDGKIDQEIVNSIIVNSEGI